MDASNKPSFSLGRKFQVGAQVLLGIIFVAAVVVMANYLASRYFVRIQISPNTRAQLSPQTLSLVRSITNDVRVTLFYDRDENLYPMISALLQEYHLNNPKISVRTVDYMRNAAEAEQVKFESHLPTNMITGSQKNWVIFECESNSFYVTGNALAAYAYEEQHNESNTVEYTREIVGFKGEQIFTAALFSITNPKRLNAYFLQGHGEANPGDDKNEVGFGKFAAAVHQNYVIPHFLSLAGTNPVPQDCSLLIIAGPISPIPEDELAKISQYLSEGGRLLAMFNASSLDRPTGLEKILAGWGVSVGNFVIRDPKHTTGGPDLIVTKFSKHPMVNSLIGSQLQLIYPRAISAIDLNVQIADAPKVEEIAFSEPESFEANKVRATRGSFPLMVAVEKSAPSGVVTDRGSTRILVVGDSIFLDNQVLDYNPTHRDFVSYALNWLLDRSVMLQGLGPRPLTKYRVMLTRSQMSTVQWVYLGAIPGGLLLLGGLVWLRRRK